jgi:UDP-N-acetylmuramoylalanine--D-glutamate ligase
MPGYDLVILGAGESGTGAAVLAKKKGMKVFVSDMGAIADKYKNVLLHHGILWEEGYHTSDTILSAGEIVKSPGIPDQTKIVTRARKKGIGVISEIELAARYTQAKKICITGSNGKTTTTMLTYDILRKAGLNVAVAGNIGKSFAWQVAEYDFDYYVLEISSFQLDGMFDFRADVAVILNITPDHLDRYNYQFSNYVESKFRIIRNQTAGDAFVYFADDSEIEKYITKHDILPRRYPFTATNQSDCAAYFNNESTFTIKLNADKLKMEIKDLSLLGKQNIYNSMAAGISARLVDIRKDVIKQSLTEFENIEHRLEHVAVVRGVEFVNDSKATNVNSTWYALESIKKPVIWIVGGIDKGNDYGPLLELVKGHVKAIVCLGTDNSRIIRTFNLLVPTLVETSSMAEAVRAAYYLAETGDAVLLSPACASFDLFENFEDRGNQFKKEVFDL